MSRRITSFGIVELGRLVHETLSADLRQQTPDDTLQWLIRRMGLHNTVHLVERVGSMSVPSGYTSTGQRVVIYSDDGWLVHDDAPPSHFDID